MSLFLKGKKRVNSNNKRGKNNVPEKGKKKRKLPEVNNEEITSSEDEGITLEKPISESEDENETAQDKKLRLAKIYLQEIERVERDKLGEEIEVGRDLISKRLKDDYLKETGKFRSYIAKQYNEDEVGEIVTLKCREQRNTITCLCVMSDNNIIFTGSKDGVVIKWNLERKNKIGIIPFVKKGTETNVTSGHSSKIASICISSDDKYLVVGEESSLIQIWNPNTLQHIKTLKGHSKSVTGLSFKRNTLILYSSSCDRSVKVWNLDEMMYVETLFGHQDAITSIDSLFKDRVATAGGRDGTLRIWKITEESQLIYNGHSGSIDVIRMINDEIFISGGEDGQISLWSFMKKKPVFIIKEAHGIDETNGQPNWICSIATLVNTDLFASGSYNGYVKLWKLAENFRSAEFLYDIKIDGFCNCLSFTSDGKRLIVSIGRDHRFGRWSTLKGARNCVRIVTLLE